MGHSKTQGRRRLMTIDDLIRLREHQERTVDEMRRHVFDTAQIPLIDELEANIRASKEDLKEKRQSDNWRVVPSD